MADVGDEARAAPSSIANTVSSVMDVPRIAFLLFLMLVMAIELPAAAAGPRGDPQ